MKRALVILFSLVVIGLNAIAQVGINNDNSAASPSAMLDVKSSNRGLLIPRLSAASRDLLPSPATGLLIYNTTSDRFNYYDGSYWLQLETIFITSTTGTISPGGGVSINTVPNARPDSSAMLDVDNPTRGILIPGTTPGLITAPVTGLIIYDISTNVLKCYNGSQWISLCTTSTGVQGATGSQPSVGMAVKVNGSSPHASAILDVSATNKGVLIPRLTNAQRDLIHPVAGLVIYNTSSNNLEYFNGSVWYQLKANFLLPPTSGTHVASASQVEWNWNTVVGAAGYKWSAVNNYAGAADIGTGTTRTETGLACGTIYTRYLWAYNSCGNSTPVILSKTTTSCFTCGSAITVNHIAGAIAPVTKTVTYGTVTNIPGEPLKCWITRNLGATGQATVVGDTADASAGWYWQFNRLQGYRHTGSTRTPNTPWITTIENFDWLAQNDPCALELGNGWRIPTSTEWTNVDAGGNWTNWTSPWSSGLNLHAAGQVYNGALYERGTSGFFWSNKQRLTNDGFNLYFNSTSSLVSYSQRTGGFSVRCVRYCQNPISFGIVVPYLENFESFTVGGYLASQNPSRWTTWSNASGTSEDAFISSAFANNSTKSVLIGQPSTTTNLILKLGDKTTGKYELKWMMYVETNKAGYYSLGHFQSPGVETACELYFRANGSGQLFRGGMSAIAFSYPKNTWFEVKQIIDLSANNIKLLINNTLVNSWPFSYSLNSTTGTKQMGCIDFWAGGTGGSGETIKFFMDNVSCTAIPELLVENFDTYPVGGYVAVQNPAWWTTWANAPGTGEDALISNAYSSSPSRSALIDETGGATDLVLKLGDKTTGKYELKWMMYVETNKAGYYNMEHFQAPGTDYAMELYFRANGDGELFAGSMKVTPFTYPKNTWFEVKNVIDLTSDNIELYINDTLIKEWPFSFAMSSASATKQIGCVDFYAGAKAGSGEVPKFFIDDVNFTNISDSIASPTSITWKWDEVPGATGYKWNTMNDYTSATDMGPATTKTETGLTCNTIYQRYIWAYNSCAVPVGIPLTQATSPCSSPTVTTTAVTNNRLNEITTGGNVTGIGGAAVTARGVCWSTASTPTIADSLTVDGSGMGSYVSDLAGLTPGTVYHLRAYATNSMGTTYGNEVTFTAWHCGDPVTYSLDNKVYNTVSIGTQCWFKENLNVGTMIPGSQNQANHNAIEKYCYDNLESNCEIYGGLYQWDNMMQWSATPGVQGICPTGWHVPSDPEWTVLTTFLGGEYSAGGKMKETGTAHWNAPNTGATNSSNFTAFAAGSRGSNALFASLLDYALFWSSTPGTSTRGWSLFLSSNDTGAYRYNYFRTGGFSVRCLQNSPLGNSLNPNAVIIDTVTSQLLSDSTQLSQGLYTFHFDSTPPVLEPGKIITGPAGEGFLRKVTGVVTPGNPITLQTQQATMEDLFNNAGINFESGVSFLGSSAGQQQNPIKINYLADGVTLSPDGFTFNFSNKVIFDNSGITFTITDGSVVFKPKFTGDIEIRLFKSNKILLQSKNTTMALNCNVNLHATENHNLPGFECKLADVDTRVMIPGIPVWVVLNTKLTAALTVNVEAAIDMNTGFSDTYNANIGLQYLDHAWKGWCDITKNLSVNPLTTTGTIDVVQKLTITPEVTIKFYGVAGTHFTPELWEKFNMAIVAPSLDWNAGIQVGLDATVAATAAIFGDIPALTKPFYFGYNVWNAPDSLFMVSGNHQQGTAGMPLTEPLKVMAKDTLGNPLAGVMVHFEVTGGGGSVAPLNVPTNTNGYAQTTWTPGTATTPQMVSAKINKANGATISEQKFTMKEPYSIVIVSGNNQSNATLGQQLPLPVKVMVKDAAGLPYSGALVRFTANNGGAVSQAQVATGSDGLASVNWTLGSTDASQTLTVTAFRVENNTPLQGSPMIFTAGTFVSCAETPAVTYGGQVYNTVQIGNQCWFRENLNIGTRINGLLDQTGNGVIEKHCYNDLELNCNVYGGLYQWDEAMQNSTTPGARGICPTGWHIPTQNEWDTITIFLGQFGGGGKMKSTGTIQTGTGLWYSPNTDATNESGFTAVPAGRNVDYIWSIQFIAIGEDATWWSSSLQSAWNANCIRLGYSVSHIDDWWLNLTSSFSVRCLRDY